MIIKYRRCDDPETEKIYDTVKAFQNDKFITWTTNQNEYDQFELDKFKKRKDEGIVIDYYVDDNDQ